MTTPADDLVERLREFGPLAHEAAARIVADAERIAALIENLHTEQDRTHRYLDRAERAEAELEAAREDAERYRAIRAVEAQGQTLAAYDANVDRIYARKGTT